MQRARRFPPGRQGRNAGFTLIELMIVVAVVGILVGPLVVAALFLAADRRERTEALPEVPHKRVECYLGLHDFVTATSGNERFLRCKHCGKYGGTGVGGVWTHHG